MEGYVINSEKEIVIVSVGEKHYKITLLKDPDNERDRIYVQEIEEPIFVEEVSRNRRMADTDIRDLMFCVIECFSEDIFFYDLDGHRSRNSEVNDRILDDLRSIL